MDDPVSRFWGKYIKKTVVCNVPDGARRWYVKHIEAFIKAHSDRRLADLKGRSWGQGDHGDRLVDCFLTIPNQVFHVLAYNGANAFH